MHGGHLIEVLAAENGTNVFKDTYYYGYLSSIPSEKNKPFRQSQRGIEQIKITKNLKLRKILDKIQQTRVFLGATSTATFTGFNLKRHFTAKIYVTNIFDDLRKSNRINTDLSVGKTDQ